MLKTTIAIILPIALTGCAMWQKEPGSASISKADPAAICGPRPDPVAPNEAVRMLELDAWLTAYLMENRPQDLDLFERRYLAEPQELRDQVRTCRRLVADPAGT